MKYFQLGRVVGIDILVNWSWLFIFGLVSWSLSLTFGQVHPDWSTDLRWGMAMLAALFFFLSVLAHELAHSLVAQARGVPVANITLFMFGGVSNMQREPSSPAEELVITIVGPLTSLFLGAVCLVIGADGLLINAGSLTAPAILSRLEPMNSTLAWLGSVNIMIGLFNLIPSFPLDGGRMIRALVWAARKDIRSSTRWATRLGQALAWTMIMGGLVMVFGESRLGMGNGLFHGIWLILIGLFLNHAASTSYRQTVLEEALSTVQVRSLMQTRVPVIDSRATLGDLLNRNLNQADGHTMFVMEDEEVVGMVAVQDIKRSISQKWSTSTVSDVMTPLSDLLYVSADEDAFDAFERLERFDMRQIPVMLNSRVVGLLHRKDVHRLLKLNSEPGF